MNTALYTVGINDEIESFLKALHDATHSASLEILGLPVRKHQNWFSDNNTDVQQLIDKMHKPWTNDKSSSRKENADKKCRGQVQRALRHVKEGLQNSKKLHREWILKLFNDGFKKVYRPQQHCVTLIFSSNRETLLTDESDILKRWKDHFEFRLSH
ncbi:Hypothetical predicted protein [Octopus vulgaris]|uniref:Uncharacterized protein n=1 Tax=Octopus vulgaris TaxID=6645 RepID=A0AA36BHY0_OCTVU|nr:Hypothetical predicted protein [Octopus vulgaris]